MAFMDTSALKKSINSIGKTSTKLRDNIQHALISCVYQDIKGNTDYFNMLLKAVGTGARLQGIVLWAETHGFVQYSKKEGKFINNKSKRAGLAEMSDAEFDTLYAELLVSAKWYEIAGKEPVKSAFDVSDYMKGVEKKLEGEGQADMLDFVHQAVLAFKKQQAIKEMQATAEQAAAEVANEVEVTDAPAEIAA